MTTEEIEKTAEEYSENARLQSNYPHHKQSSYDGFLMGVEFANKIWQEKEDWTLISTELPPVGEEVLLQNDKWIHEDYNPKGIRIGFLDGDECYYTAYWCSYHDEYHTCDSSEDNPQFKLKAIDQIPIKWKEIK